MKASLGRSTEVSPPLKASIAVSPMTSRGIGIRSFTTSTPR